MNNFKIALKEKLIQSRSNNFGLENYDEYRFGKMLPNSAKMTGKSTSLINKIKNIIKPDRNNYSELAESTFRDLKKYETDLEKLWRNLNEQGRNLLVSLFAYRIFGYKKIKLPANNKQYWDAIDTAKSLKCSDETYDPHFKHFILEKFNLEAIGYNITFFFSAIGIAIDFIIEQYAYKSGETKIVQVTEGDIVLDIGGCWGDTALYFSHKIGNSGKVYSFEFIPDNIKLFNINTSLNPHLKSQIQLVPNPVSNKTGDTIYFKDNGPGSQIQTQPFNEQTGSSTTISIDDFVKQNNISKVDFIKMDIEGAEQMALNGALETIKKFKPKLAIAIYHSMDDFVNIPKWIMNLNLGYELFIDHYTIHTEETVCFAKIKGS